MAEAQLLRVRRILDKLKQVRTRRLSYFGSDNHCFRLNDRLGEADLEAFEQTHRIRLPSDYRAFLQHGGNGGAGPYYGIYPLDKCNDLADWVMEERPDDFLVRACPLHPDLKPTEDWAEQFGDASPYQGTLSLGTRGCTYMMQLVLTGPYSGRVVYADADGHPPYMIREPDFLSWYERWLDELLGGYKMDSFGYGPGGGEEDFFRILDDPEANDDFKSEAAVAFFRLPSLSNAAARRIGNYLNHPIPGVRSGACATVRGFKIHDACEAASRLLNDPTPYVRREAVWTVMKLDPRRWTETVRQRLREDSDDDVATTAFFELEEAKALPKPELLRIVEQSPLGNLRYLAAYKVEWAKADFDLLIRMLSDSHSQVRFYATLGLRQLKAKDSLPQVLEVLARENDQHVVASILYMFKELGNSSVVPTLLKWAESEDDFHRLEAIEALAKIGDERAAPIVQTMLQEDRPPVRRDAHGFMSQSSVHTIRDLVRKSLRESPNRTLRKLAD
jgi:HEAT repeat protein